MTVFEKVCTACGEPGAPSTLTVTVPIASTVHLGAVATSSTVTATSSTAATPLLGAFHNARPNQRNGTGTSPAGSVIPSTVVFAPAATPNRVAAAAGAANATGNVSAMSPSSMVMFEGRAGTVAVSLGTVILGAVAVMVL